MGGLVARAAIEDDKLDPSNVDRLIMIAPPNYGSVCANWGYGGDVWEHIICKHCHNPRRFLLDSSEDGLGQARRDMRPDSLFLKQLNGRGRNRRVQYSILLGKGGEIDEAQVRTLHDRIERLEERNRLTQLVGPSLDRLQEDLNELAGEGDGIVAVKRGRLTGVDDVEVLEFQHWLRLGDHHDPQVRAVHDAVARRLQSAN